MTTNVPWLRGVTASILIYALCGNKFPQQSHNHRPNFCLIILSKPTVGVYAFYSCGYYENMTENGPLAEEGRWLIGVIDTSQITVLTDYRE